MKMFGKWVVMPNSRADRKMRSSPSQQEELGSSRGQGREMSGRTEDGSSRLSSWLCSSDDRSLSKNAVNDTYHARNNNNGGDVLG